MDELGQADDESSIQNQITKILDSACLVGTTEGLLGQVFAKARKHDASQS